MTDLSRATILIRNLESLEPPLRDGDLFVAARGYEARCTFLRNTLAKRVGPQVVDNRTLLVDFEPRNLTWPGKPRYTCEASQRPLLETARSVIRETQCKRLVVDYSCMSRALYLGLLSALDWGVNEIVFSYSIGRYGSAELDYPVLRVGEVRPVPRLEGLAFATRPRLFVFGLGYDGQGTLALAERLEVERFAALWADPGASARSAGLASSRNSELISRAVMKVRTDLRDVAGTTRVLRQLAFETQDSDKLVMVPVGPKPHVLACGLAASQFEHVTVLSPYHQGGLSEPLAVEADGRTVTCSVTKRPVVERRNTIHQ